MTKDAEQIEVTQADREAAACVEEMWNHGWGGEVFRDGVADEHPLVQAFAKHRLAHSTPAPDTPPKTRMVRDTDAICNACRWKGVHDPTCPARDVPWPMIEVPAPDTILSLQARIARLEEALEPSGDTKAAYMGEFSFTIMQAQEDEHGEAIEVPSRTYVPWTTIKEIMAAIRARAVRGRGLA